MPYQRITFPDLGWSDSVAFRVGNRRVAQEAENVMPRDPFQERRRLATRQGFVALHDVPNDDAIQWMGSFRVYRDDGSGGYDLVQGVLVVAAGRVYELTTGGVTERLAGTLTHALAADDDIEGVVHRNVAYLVNGRWYYRIDLSAQTPEIEDWTATEGPDVHVASSSIAAGTFGHGATLIAEFGARLVLAGLLEAPTNWFMSSVGDPDDWAPVYDAGATAGGLSGDGADEYGVVAEPITAIGPLGSSGFLIGTTGSLSHLTGDPQFSDTRMVTVSRAVGVVGPRAMCPGPEKTVYVCSTDGVYRVAPNTYGLDRGDRLTADRLDGFFSNTDFLDLDPVLAYDDHQHILWLFANRTDEPALSLHYVMDATTGSWWPQRLMDDRMPVVTSTAKFRPLSGERPVLWCAGLARIATQPPTGVYPRDGMSLPGSPYNLPEEGDEGHEFVASILMGPFNMEAGERVLLRDVRVILGADRQADVLTDETGLGPQLTVIAGASAQEAVGESGDLVVDWEARRIHDGGMAGTVSWDDSVDGGAADNSGSPPTDTAIGGFAYPVTGRYSPQSTALPGSQSAYAGPGEYLIERNPGDGRWDLTGPDGLGSRLTYFRTAVPAVSPSGQYANEQGYAAQSILDARSAGFANREVVAERVLRRGMNNALRMRVRASDIYLGIEATGRTWSLEDMSVDIVPGGRVRQWHDIDTDPGIELERP